MHPFVKETLWYVMSLSVMYIDIGSPNDLRFAPHISGTIESVCVLSCISSWYVAYISALCVFPRVPFYLHYYDVTMSSMASQITSLAIVYSVVYSDADQRKHQSSASLAFVRGIHRWPVNSPHKWPVTRKMFPFDDVIMSFRNKIVSYSLDVYQLKFYELP